MLVFSLQLNMPGLIERDAPQNIEYRGVLLANASQKSILMFFRINWAFWFGYYHKNILKEIAPFLDLFTYWSNPTTRNRM